MTEQIGWDVRVLRVIPQEYVEGALAGGTLRYYLLDKAGVVPLLYLYAILHFRGVGEGADDEVKLIAPAKTGVGGVELHEMKNYPWAEHLLQNFYAVIKDSTEWRTLDALLRTPAGTST